MPSQRYTVRLPQGLDAQVQDYIRTTGTPFAVLMREALAAYLADSPPTAVLTHPPTPADSADSLYTLGERLAVLWERVEALERAPTGRRQGADRAPTGLPTAADRPPQEFPVHHGRPGLPRATLQAIATERTRYPALTMKAFAQHLFDQGIYRGLARDGREVPADHSRLRRWVAQARKAGLLADA